MEKPFLSIIIPAYNEAKRLPGSLTQIIDFLKGQPYSSEVIVVENGSQDCTLQVARGFVDRPANGKIPVRVYQLEQRGKGLAIKRGMLESRGEYRFMCDADLSMPVDQLNRFLPPMLEDFDIAIASREAKGAVRYHEPAYRHFVGRVFNTLIRVLALPDLHDTQCGFKCFRAEVVEDVFRCQTLDGWSFDVEVLFIARKHGYRIVELPIPWYFNPESHVKVVKDSLRMAIDLIKIRVNGLRGRYG